MAKIVADNLIQLKMSFLKKEGYLNGYQSSHVSWSSYYDTSIIGVEVEIPYKMQYPQDASASPYMRLRYSQTDHEGNKKDFDYKVELVTTSCKFGGERFWFTCPLTVNDKVCGRRVGVLFKAGDYFGCRHCYNLVYAVQNYGGLSKVSGKIVGLLALDRMKKEIKRERYNGKYTKRYVRYLELRNKNWGGFMAASCALDAKSGQRADFWRKVGKPWQEFYKSKRGAKFAKKRKAR